MNTAFWTVQALLAAIFLITGTIKLTQPRSKLAAGPMRWAADVTDTQFRTIGGLEVLAVLGLFLAAALNAPILRTVAAAGLALTMVGAMATHARYRETERIAFPVVLLVVSIFVATTTQGL